MKDFFKKYFIKYFDQKGYLNFKANKKIQESIMIFKKTLKKQLAIYKNVLMKKTLNFYILEI